ncbi:protein PLASTID REDOX INSENSITIVE 2, chloroplastic-like isoform X1 [Actinidia eriantha]|uniref:protein PLASTID REDOX INSENSITIVE 2, chloroplastic-like isoform X1 n=1 Tax=Actinidia eriantha TaxID=165200 RepID=UPI00258E8125|nr:protein PLASTID REDOX INSENSITIVE 2, chloroplastic-like isoform X1 [Actinidia eriantha]
MASALSIFPSPTLKSSLSSLYNSSSSSTGTWVSVSFSYRHSTHAIRASSFNHSHINPPILSKRNGSIYPSLHHFSSSFNRLICRADYKFPDPIPEFAETETEKFRDYLMKKLTKKDLYGDSLEKVVGICSEIFSTFLHTEYGGPGTLLVLPFIDMSDALNEQGLPGGPQAASAAVKWATDHVDKDWKEWTSGNGNQ